MMTLLVLAGVSVATGDWTGIPLIAERGGYRVSTRSVEQIMAARQAPGCNLRGEPGRTELDVPFLLRFTPDGALDQVVIRRLDCPQVERLVGGVVQSLAERGAYRPTGVNDAGWYRGNFRLSVR